MQQAAAVFALLAILSSECAFPARAPTSELCGNQLSPHLPLRTRASLYTSLVTDQDSGALIEGWMVADPAVTTSADVHQTDVPAVGKVAPVCGGTILRERWSSWQPCELVEGTPLGFRFRGVVLRWSTNKEYQFFAVLPTEQAIEEIRTKLRVQPTEAVEDCFVYWEFDPGCER